jgi:hypothetical protein
MRVCRAKGHRLCVAELRGAAPLVQSGFSQGLGSRPAAHLNKHPAEWAKRPVNQSGYTASGHLLMAMPMDDPKALHHKLYTSR